MVQTYMILNQNQFTYDFRIRETTHVSGGKVKFSCLHINRKDNDLRDITVIKSLKPSLKHDSVNTFQDINLHFHFQTFDLGHCCGFSIIIID